MQEIEKQVREAYVRSVPGGFGGTWKCNRPGRIPIARTPPLIVAEMPVQSPARASLGRGV